MRIAQPALGAAMRYCARALCTVLHCTAQHLPVPCAKITFLASVHVLRYMSMHTPVRISLHMTICNLDTYVQTHVDTCIDMSIHMSDNISIHMLQVTFFGWTATTWIVANSWYHPCPPVSWRLIAPQILLHICLLARRDLTSGLGRGSNWGENGFFRIKQGNDCLGVETKGMYLFLLVPSPILRGQWGMGCCSSAGPGASDHSFPL